jgi:hypothetical protein
MDLSVRDPSVPPQKPELSTVPTDLTIKQRTKLARRAAVSNDYKLVVYWKELLLHHLIVRPVAFLLDNHGPSSHTEYVLSAPSWPAPSFNHLFGDVSGLPYSIPHSAEYDIEQDIAASSVGSFSVIEDASDEHAFNLFQLTDDTLSLSAAGYTFTFAFTVTDSVPFDDELPVFWREYHAKMKALDAEISSLTQQASPVSWSDIASTFLSEFSPAIAARVATRNWMYSFTEGKVTVNLSRRFYHCYPVAYMFNISTQHIPLIVDSGASVCITPCKSDFIPNTYRESNMKVRDLSGENAVAGEGLVRWAVLDSSGNTRVIEIAGIHIPTAGVRLLSPQVLRHTHGIGGSIEDDGIHLTGQDSTIIAKYNAVSNLPELQLVDMPKTSPVWSDTYGELNFSSDPSLSGARQAYLNVIDTENRNLTPGEKELMLWHQRLSHTNISKVRDLCSNRQWVRLSPEVTNAIPTDAILPTKQKSTSRADHRRVKCAGCCMAKQCRRSTTSVTRPTSSDEEMKLKKRHLAPGHCISVDHYVSPVRGRSVSGYGATTSTKGYTGGSLYVDHASGRIFHYPQSDLTADSTIQGKQLLEEEAKAVNVTVKAYHSDNGIFASQEFKDHCKGQKQELSFSGVGGHHQNGVAERCIGTISRMARANLLHLMIHWPEWCNPDLWALSMDYAVWVYNRTPRESLGGLSPEEFWSGCRSDNVDLRRSHVFGCPVYVLDPKLQDGKSIPKWNSRSRLGMFVGFSNAHSSLVPLVLNLQTGHISPQFHVVFDDHFHTVPSLHSSQSQIDDIFANLYDNGKGSARDRFIPVDEVSEGAPVATESEGAPDGSPSDSHLEIPPTVPEGALPPNAPLPSEPDNDDTPAIDLYDFDPQDESLPSGMNNHNLRRSKRSEYAKRKPVKPGFVYKCMLLPLAASYYGTWGQPPLDGANFCRQHAYHANAKVTRGSLDTKRYLRSSLTPVHSAFTAGLCGNNLVLPWDGNENDFNPSVHLYNAEVARTASLISPEVSSLNSPGTHFIDCIQPHALAAKRGNDLDNPTYDEAMSGEYQSDYYNAAMLELKTLQEDLQCWELVRRTDSMNVLPSTWAFKCKRYPDGRVKKFKARFCARGDRQKEGIDYFETWSPVVQWQTVRLMMVFSSILGLKSSQADITAAFVHATLPADEHVYIHQPRGFKVDMNDGHEYVLKLKKSLYGLKQAPRHFFQYLTKHLQKHGLRQSNCDPCLFISNDIIVIVYVDDLLLYARDDSTIDSLISKLKKDDIWIRKEESTEGYLGVDISDCSSDGSFTLTQSGLTKRVIEALGLHADWTGSKETPADVTALPKDTNGTPADPLVQYSSVVGMLLYLSGHTRPDIAFAVHQCARYTFQPTHRHVTALKRIGRYLKGTHDKGLIMRPSKRIHVDCYPDADFAGLYNKEDAQDPHCVRSRTGYVICVANCPVIWRSKLQSEIALSTMEAEYISLSQACKDLFPLLDLIQELGSACGLQIDNHTNLHVKVHEDNVGALTLGKLEPRRMTPRSKHYAIKYHWFREHIGPRNIELVKIDTKEQLGDMFTKGLSPIPFKHLRLKLMGW